ncbi:hypothetical protein [Paracoccus ravus]|uniref:hypothetical protein n=1 Tax=Paracoccus ravus TaxID=2447760 RepID=UPI00106EEBDA|nr:hypothetical protein [Paracoccus ravus]
MERTVCNRNCWISGAIAGVVVLLFTAGIGDLGFFGGLFLGLLTFWLFGAMLVWLVCAGRPEMWQAVSARDWRREAAEHEPEAMLVSAGLADPVTSASQMPIVAGAMPAPKPTREQVPVMAYADLVADETRAGDVAEPSGADDLRRIKGVGPKLALWLNDNGVTRFEQIARWDAQEAADFAGRLGRMGSRIETDDWVGQARLLAAGGDTAHSRAVERGEAT